MNKLVSGQLLICVLILPHANASQFSTIINVPPSTVGNLQLIEANTQLNVFAGGQVGFGVQATTASGASSNIEMNVFAGSIDDEFVAGNGTVVNIHDGLVGDRFNAWGGSQVNISGGAIGNNFVAGALGPGAVVNITGGSIGEAFRAFPGTTVNVSGGVIGSNFITLTVGNLGATVNITGGSIGSFTVNSFGKARIAGGMFPEYVSVFADVDISGGVFSNNFLAFAGSTVNLIGRSFFLDGVPISGLSNGNTFTIVDRDRILSGVFADGSPFSFDLMSAIPGSDAGFFFSREALLTIRVVPEPTSFMLAASCLPLIKRRRK